MNDEHHPVAEPTVLIVDDEPDIRELLNITLGRMRLSVSAAANVAEAKALLSAKPFALCLCDLRLPDGDGLSVVSFAQQLQPDMPVAVISAHGNMELAIEAMKAGAFDFVAKPLDIDALRQLVEQALRVTKPTAVSSNSPTEAPSPATDSNISSQTPLTGSSAKMQALRELVGKLARSQVPVYIGGESGSGKEVVARAIHQQGPRSSGPFTAVNCGAIPGELMESEFFGHKKGSFTGAHSDKQGLFQAANGGSLFLDEIADLPLSMQVKLLRAIQQRAVRPVGSNEEVRVDVRLLSASHRNLADMVSSGEFRQDLFYRINVISVDVPPLRARMEDLPALIDNLLAKQLLRNSGVKDSPEANIHNNTPALSPAALQQLQQHSFPGNVRELENILERALALSEGRDIKPEHLHLISAEPISGASSQHAAKSAVTAEITTPPPAISLNSERNLEQQLEEIERIALQQALETARYNKTAAAELLGISFRSFRYRLKKLKME